MKRQTKFFHFFFLRSINQTCNKFFINLLLSITQNRILWGKEKVEVDDFQAISLSIWICENFNFFIVLKINNFTIHRVDTSSRVGGINSRVERDLINFFFRFFSFHLFVLYFFLLLIMNRLRIYVCNLVCWLKIGRKN